MFGKTLNNTIIILMTLAICLFFLSIPIWSYQNPGITADKSEQVNTTGYVKITNNNCLPPAIQMQLDLAWANESPYIAKSFRQDLINETPDGLYNIQVYTNNLLDFVAVCNDTPKLNDLIGIYNTSYQYLTLTPDGYHEWICSKTCVNSSSYKKESNLDSLQFLYLISRTLNIISTIDPPERTTEMNKFIKNFGPLATESYIRWQPGYTKSVKQKISMKLNRETTPDAISDEELWLSAGMVELLAANQKNPNIGISENQQVAMLQYINLTNDLIRSRAYETNLKDFKGTSVKGIIIDYGETENVSDNLFACYTGESFPLPNQTCTANSGWDISHGRRFVHVFQSLHSNRNITGTEFPDDEFITQLANELIYGSSNRDMAKPLFTNYFGGMNGWYRVGYHGPDFGYPPYGLTDSVPLGGYGYWTSYNPDVGMMMHSLLNLSESQDPFIKKYYPNIQTNVGKIQFLPTFARIN
jgi:hypothetical protein